MSEIRVMAWNVRDGLAEPNKAEAIAEKIYEVDPDIAILTEGIPEKISIIPEAQEILEELGAIHVRPYSDPDKRLDRHSLVAVARAEFGKPIISRPMHRVAMTFPDANGFVVAGLHGFDRRNGNQDAENARWRQLASLIGSRAMQNVGPAIILGDLNAMHARAPQRDVLKTVGKLARKFTPGEPGHEQSRLKRGVSLAMQLGSMATGDALHMTRREGFIDADLDRQPTMRKGPIAVQLDHILVRQAIVRSFAIHPHEGLSDHDAISAVVATKDF